MTSPTNRTNVFVLTDLYANGCDIVPLQTLSVFLFNCCYCVLKLLNHWWAIQVHSSIRAQSKGYAGVQSWTNHCIFRWKCIKVWWPIFRSKRCKRIVLATYSNDKWRAIHTTLDTADDINDWSTAQVITWGLSVRHIATIGRPQSERGLSAESSGLLLFTRRHTHKAYTSRERFDLLYLAIGALETMAWSQSWNRLLLVHGPSVHIKTPIPVVVSVSPSITKVQLLRHTTGVEH